MADSIPSIPDQHPAPANASTSQIKGSPTPLPRVTIRFCTQCKWMLRAAYFAQELLSTFSTSLGEVALQPATGGIFVVEIFHAPTDPSAQAVPDADMTIQRLVLWDRKLDGGFPETKELKRRVRDVIEPGRNLGHVDRDYPRQQQQTDEGARQKKTPDANGPAHDDPQTPAVPAVTRDSASNTQDPPSQVPPRTQKSREECGDCQ